MLFEPNIFVGSSDRDCIDRGGNDWVEIDRFDLDLELIIVDAGDGIDRLEDLPIQIGKIEVVTNIAKRPADIASNQVE